MQVLRGMRSATVELQGWMKINVGMVTYYDVPLGLIPSHFRLTSTAVRQGTELVLTPRTRLRTGLLLRLDIAETYTWSG